VGVAGWVTGPGPAGAGRVVRAALPDADRARFEQDLVQALKIARSTRDLAPLGQVVEGVVGGCCSFASVAVGGQARHRH
jgi:hypothetical protein